MKRQHIRSRRIHIYNILLGFPVFHDEQPSAPGLFVEIRKRMGKDVFAVFEEVILDRLGLSKPSPELEEKNENDYPENKGKMLVDATVADRSIYYPAGSEPAQRNEAREISEGLIDDLYKQSDCAEKP